MFAKKMLLGSVFSLFLAGTAIGQTPVEAMDGFYSKSKGTLFSTTPAGAYKSQTRYAATGGSYVWRAEQKNLVPYSAQLPSISAGCGGIDIYAGSFSFINGDQLESLFRAILQDAAGFAFHLALKEISQELSDSITSLTTMMNSINAQNINSCEAAQGLVNSAVDIYNSQQKVTCAVSGASAGLFSDSLSGSTCGSTGTAGESAAAAIKAGLLPDAPTNQNYAMKATEGSSISDSIDLREFYMSISGTLITFSGTEQVYKFVNPIGLDESIIRALMTGGTIVGHECIAFEDLDVDYSKEDCFRIEENNNSITIPASAGFLVRVEAMLGSIYDKAANDDLEDPTPEELAFVEDTPLPVLRAAQLYSIAYPESGREMLLGYSELIAYNIALNFLEDIYQTVLDGASGNTSADLESLTAWTTKIQNNKSVLLEQQGQLTVRFNAVQAFVSQLQDVEDRMQAKISGNLLRAASSGN